jgi:hypothetical protein
VPRRHPLPQSPTPGPQRRSRLSAVAIWGPRPPSRRSAPCPVSPAFYWVGPWLPLLLRAGSWAESLPVVPAGVAFACVSPVDRQAQSAGSTAKVRAGKGRGKTWRRTLIGFDCLRLTLCTSDEIPVFALHN